MGGPSLQVLFIVYASFLLDLEFGIIFLLRVSSGKVNGFNTMP